MGGFRLHKIMSNSKEVLSTVAQEDLAKDIQGIDIFENDLPMERTLGVQWYVQSDAFGFRVQLDQRPATCRGILSSVSSIFDPIGFVAPFMLTGKAILQDLCRDGYGWDDPVPANIETRWLKWRHELEELANLKIPRCHKDKDLTDITSVQLHHFSDASLKGYGQCSYIRLIRHEWKSVLLTGHEQGQSDTYQGYHYPQAGADSCNTVSKGQHLPGTGATIRQSRALLLH